MKTSHLNRFTFYLPDSIDIRLEELRLKLRQSGCKAAKSDLVMLLLDEGLDAIAGDNHSPHDIMSRLAARKQRLEVSDAEA